MRRSLSTGRGGGGGGARRQQKPSVLPSFELTPAADIGAFTSSRRDSEASFCSTLGPTPSSTAQPQPVPNDRQSVQAALREVNSYLSSLPTPLTLASPCPTARDINLALQLLLSRLSLALPSKPPSAAGDEQLLFLRLLRCPFKLNRAFLKTPNAPHAWPTVLAVLRWLTQLARVVDSLSASPSSATPDKYFMFVIQSYGLFISGDDDGVAELDDEYLSKARAQQTDMVASAEALERKAAELEAHWNKITSEPSKRVEMEEKRDTLKRDISKFEAVVKSQGEQVAMIEAAVMDYEKELDAKVREGQRMAAENLELKKQVEVQSVNVRDVERMRRELHAVEQDIGDAESRKAVDEEKMWELDADYARSLNKIEMQAEQCNQEIKKLKLGVDFQYALNPKGLSPSEVLGTTYKSVMKPAFKRLAEETKKLSVSKLEESITLREQLQQNAKIFEEKKNRLAAVQLRIDEAEGRLSSVKNEMENHASTCAAETGRVRGVLQQKEQQLDALEKEAEEFVKNSEQKLQDARREGEEETQMCARELLAVIDSITAYKEFMESVITGMKNDICDTADMLASVSAKLVSDS